MDADPKIPESVFRTQMAYRTRGHDSSCAVQGCGFILKPTRKDEFKDFVMDDYVVIYVLRGQGSYVDWNGKTHPLSPGCVAQRVPGRKHSTLLVPDGQWAEVFLLLDKEVFDFLASYGFVDPNRPVLHPGLSLPLIEKFESLLGEISAGTGPVPHSALLKAHEIVHDIYSLDRAAQEPDPHATLVETAKGILSGDLTERIPLPELAASLHLSYERFRKVFRERTGLSPGAFRLRRRIEAACRMLAECHSVKETAFALGYPDLHSFSKQFAQVVGVPPSTFRNRN